jgi:hypothetical protein
LDAKQFGLVSGIMVLLLIGCSLPVKAQSIMAYSSSVTPTPFLIPKLQWTVTNVTEQAVEWGWGSGDYWETKEGDQVVFEIQKIQDDELQGLFTIGNLTLFTNDSRLAAELTFSIWPWFPGLVSNLDWSTVDHNATNSATGWMEGNLEIRKTDGTKTYIYNQGPYGNQNTTLVYDLHSGLLLEGYTEFFFINDYHLGLELVRAAKYPTSLTIVIGGTAVLIAVTVMIIISFIRRQKTEKITLKEEKGNIHSFGSSKAWNASLIAILAATALAGNYALSGVPNVEISSIIVFLSGFLFGTTVGTLVGFTTMTIYQFLNPWGAFILPIGGTVIACTIFIGIVGGIVGRNFRFGKTIEVGWVTGLAFLGVMTTLFFDLVTNYAYSLTFGVPYILALATGFPFLVLHIISNALFFGFLTPAITQVVQQFQLGKG